MIEIIVTITALLLIHYSFFLLDIYHGLRTLIANSPFTVYKTIPDDFISVIIPFRNESDNILESLTSIEMQDYPKDKFEVIYINDFSDDDSPGLLSNARKSSNVIILSVPEDYSKYLHKKRAIRYGIEKARGDIIVTTDADCIHTSKWLRTLVSQFDKQTGFVSGPVEFTIGQSFFERAQRLEFAGLVLTGAGLIGINKPLICNAANIAYRRKAFYQVDGFSYKHSLSSGDDELLMQKIKSESSFKIKFCMNKDAIVKTSASRSFSQFYQQRKRWASKGLFYTDHLLILKLILIFLFYLSFPVQIVLGICISPMFLFSLVLCFILKAIPEFMILRTGAKKLFGTSILKPFIWAEFLHIPYILIAGISGLFGNYIWKEKKIKR
ncbi:MAG: glycosyltransferase [Ignavibacteriaceae bacterium]|nr:glycosyltransferase [Ignavibacteriaceae bacterium]